MSASDCIDAVRQAATRPLSDDEVEQIFQRLDDHKRRIEAEGDISGLDRKLREAARAEGQKARLAAALVRKQAALTIIARDRLQRVIESHVAEGMSYPNAALAILEGTARDITAGRKSVSAYRLAYEGRYVGDMMAEIQAARPHILHALGDDRLMTDVVREMAEMKTGGKPGITGNADARFVADTFAKWAEISRRDLNRFGANIGKLDGWAGPQVHDPFKLLRVTADEWIKKILPRLDLDRTFGRDQARIDANLADRENAFAARDEAARDQRDAAIEMDQRQGRLDQLQARAKRLTTLRQVAETRLAERQSESAANLGRRMDVHDAAGTRPTDFARGQAREQGVSLTRLRRRAETAQDTLARIESQISDTQARIADQQAKIERLQNAHADATARLTAAGDAAKRLDLERGDLRRAVDDPVEFLRQAYTTITTGRDNTPTAAGKGDFVGPANLARSLERHRVLHFKSADDWLAYQAEFGHGNVVTAMMEHQRRAARLAAQMEVLGPNPEAMMNSLLDSLQRKVRDDPAIPAGKKAGIIAALHADRWGRIANALAEARGLTLAPVNLTAARIGSGIRAAQSMAKLGGAVISSVADVVTSAANLTYHGAPLLRAWGDQLAELGRGRGKDEQREIAYLIGEGFDGLIGEILARHASADGAPGLMSRTMETFFRWSGLTWWTDARRAGAARMLSAWMGNQTEHGWADLNRRFRHGLTLHGVDEPMWEAIRQAKFREVNGRTYVTPDRIAALPVETIDTLIPAADIGLARDHFKLAETTMKQFGRDVPVPPELAAARQEKFAAWRDRARARARHDLEITVRRYMADETNFTMLEPDEQTRRQMYHGTRPGTAIGEGLRFLMQFKSFSLAFADRVLARAVLGGQGETTAQRLLSNAGHIGQLIAGLTIAGYVAMTAKDASRGWWPPRDPKDPRTWLAAFQQGGGLGIYGDYLFGQASRFGNSALETAAGPTASSAATLLNIWARTRDGDPKAADYFNLALQNTPFVNLFYARPALDYLVLNGLHETLSPGYLMRQERSRRKDMGQTRLWEVQR